MKGDIVNLKGEEAKVIGEVAVSIQGQERPIIVYLYELTGSGTFIVARNSFTQGASGDKAKAIMMFLSVIQDEAI